MHDKMPTLTHYYWTDGQVFLGAPREQRRGWSMGQWNESMAGEAGRLGSDCLSNSCRLMTLLL